MSTLHERFRAANASKRNLNTDEFATLRSLIERNTGADGTFNVSEVARQFSEQRRRTITRKSIAKYVQRTNRDEGTNFAPKSQSFRRRESAALAEASQIKAGDGKIVIAELARIHNLSHAAATYALTNAGLLEAQVPHPNTLTGRTVAFLSAPQAHQLVTLTRNELLAAIQDEFGLRSLSASVVTRALRHLSADLKELHRTASHERLKRTFSGAIDGITIPLEETVFFRSPVPIVQAVRRKLSRGLGNRDPIKTGDDFVAAISDASGLSFAPANAEGAAYRFLKGMHLSGGVIGDLMKAAIPRLIRLTKPDRENFASAVDAIGVSRASHADSNAPLTFAPEERTAAIAVNSDKRKRPLNTAERAALNKVIAVNIHNGIVDVFEIVRQSPNVTSRPISLRSIRRFVRAYLSETNEGLASQATIASPVGATGESRASPADLAAAPASAAEERVTAATAEAISVRKKKRIRLNPEERTILIGLIAGNINENGTINAAKIHRQLSEAMTRPISRKSILEFAERNAAEISPTLVPIAQSLEDRLAAAEAAARQIQAREEKINLAHLSRDHKLDIQTLRNGLIAAGLWEAAALDPGSLVGRTVTVLTDPQASQLLVLTQKELLAAVQDRIGVTSLSDKVLTQSLQRLPDDLKMLREAALRDRAKQRFEVMASGASISLKDTAFFGSHLPIVQKVLRQLTTGTKDGGPVTTDGEFTAAVVSVADKLPLPPTNTAGRARLFLKEMYLNSGIVAGMMKAAIPHLTRLDKADQAAFASAVDEIGVSVPRIVDLTTLTLPAAFEDVLAALHVQVDFAPAAAQATATPADGGTKPDRRSLTAPERSALINLIAGNTRNGVLDIDEVLRQLPSATERPMPRGQIHKFAIRHADTINTAIAAASQTVEERPTAVVAVEADQTTVAPVVVATDVVLPAPANPTPPTPQAVEDVAVTLLSPIDPAAGEKHAAALAALKQTVNALTAREVIVLSDPLTPAERIVLNLVPEPATAFRETVDEMVAAAKAETARRAAAAQNKPPKAPSTDTTGMVKLYDDLAVVMDVDDRLIEARASRIGTMLRNIASLSKDSTADEIRFVFFELSPLLRMQQLHVDNTGMVLVETLQTLMENVGAEALASYSQGWKRLIQNLQEVSRGLHSGSGSTSTRVEASQFLTTLAAVRNGSTQSNADALLTCNA